MGVPNVIVVLLDTARADVFEPYGAAPGSSPAIAQLATLGHAAPAMTAPSGWTLPSHAGMFTGLQPRAAGLARAPGRSPVSCKAQVERHADRLLPSVMRRNGYATRGVSSNMWITPDSGFGTGFDHFDVVRGGRSTGMAHPGLKGALRWGFHALRCIDDDGSTEAEAILRRSLAEAGGTPFFWFVNLVECHSPYLPPRPYTDRGPLTRLKAARLARQHYNLGAIWRTCLGDLDLADDELELLRHLYRRSILQLDAWIGRLLESLDSAGRLDETVVIVTSDHGENFGENGLIGHSFSLDERLIRVPFIAAGPSAPRLDRTASLVELPRLIAEAAGIDDHPWESSTLTDGIAVAQFDGPADLDDRTRHTAAKWGLDDEAVLLLTSPQTAVTDGRHKLVERAGSTHLFDLVADALEERPLPEAEAPEALAKALAQAAAPGPAPVLPGDAPGPDADLEERMRLLGYM